MPNLLSLIKTFHEHYQTALNKRFLPLSVMVALLGMLWISNPAINLWVWVLLTFLLGVFFLLRGHIVLPHEKKWLDKCATLIDSCDYPAAEACLLSAPVFLGFPAQIQWTLRKIKFFALTGDFVKEHEAVQQLKKLALFSSEQHQCRLNESSIYYRNGNFKRFGELLDTVDKEVLPDNKCKAQYHLLSSHKNEIAGNYPIAKAEIESLLEDDACGSHHAILYNNLARLEEMQGNELQAVHYYEKALALLRSNPVPNLYPVVYQNLIMHFARTGKILDAKVLLEEYGAAIDVRVPCQYLEYLNTQINLARQLNDLQLLLQAYALIDLRIKPKLEQDEWTAQFRSELRTRANDGVGLNEHLVKAGLLFNDLMRQPFPKDYFILKELFGVLRQQAETNQLGTMKNLFERTLSALLATASKIDTFRKTIPDALLEPHFFWIEEKNSLHKLTPVSQADYDKNFFNVLFGLLKELVRISVDKDNSRLQLRALVMLCEEYAEYSPYMDLQFETEYLCLAKQSLQDANDLMQFRVADPALLEYMVGLAWCESKINASAERASHWINLFETKNISLRHHALWFRQQYGEVKDWLNEQ